MEEGLYETFAEQEDRHWWFAGRRDVLRTVMQPHFGVAENSPPKSILDVGCGTGGMFSLLREFGDVEGMDASQTAIAFCRSRFGDDVRLTVGELPECLSAIGQKDAITAFDVIEHIDDDIGVLREIEKHLVPGGLFVCTVPAYPWLWSRHDEVNHHKRRYTKKLLLSRLAGAGFQVRFVSHFNAVLLPAIATVRLMQHVVGGKRSPRGDFEKTPGILNGLLHGVLSMEALLLRRTTIPFGVSLIAVCEKRAAGSSSQPLRQRAGWRSGR